MRRGLVIVYTGDGKGKTTAALGMLLRAWGHGFRLCAIQFIKAEGGDWGEVKAARKLDEETGFAIEWHKVGDGFTWLSDDMQETIAHARRGWALAQEKIASGNYDLILLDEFTYPLHFGWLEAAQVMDWLRQHKPPELHLVITGRNAPEALLEYADLVTEMKAIKHPYEQGIRAQAGIDF